MNKIKGLIKDILNVNTSHILIASIATLLATLLLARGQITIVKVGIIILLVVFFYLQIKLGSVVIKSVISGFTVLYMTSFYSYITMELHGVIVQPFLLTIATATAFLGLTHVSYNLSIRSRSLWVAILITATVTIKSTVILLDYSYLVSEVVGLNFLVIFSAIWFFWANNSNKSKLISPILKDKQVDEFKYVYIEGRLSVKDKSWLDDDGDEVNAYPFIYTEVMKAKEKKLNLVIISSLSTSKTYDVGYVRHNLNEIPYLYIEAESDTYMNDIIYQFKQEILKK